jgi:endo-1,4-beta-D-glucanase Y
MIIKIFLLLSISFPESDWNELQDEWERNNYFKDSSEGFQAHLEKRKSKMIGYKTEYWFDVTSFFGMNNDLT